MNLKQWLFDEDRGVSPVIGVILMVAITVILAAVIATFVMNMGPDEEQVPTTTFDFNKEFTGSGSGDVTITHDGGNSVETSKLSLELSSGSATIDDWSGTISAGATETISGVSSGTTIEVVWNAEQSDKSDILATYEVP